MATGHGAVGRHLAFFCFVAQRFFLHVALVAGSLGMAGFAPSNTISGATVVIHPEGRPACRVCMARITGHAPAQLGLGNVIGRLALRCRPVMAGGTTARYYPAVSPHRCRRPRGRAVTSVARGRGR